MHHELVVRWLRHVRLSSHDGEKNTRASRSDAVQFSMLLSIVKSNSRKNRKKIRKKIKHEKIGKKFCFPLDFWDLWKYVVQFLVFSNLAFTHSLNSGRGRIGDFLRQKMSIDLFRYMD